MNGQPDRARSRKRRLPTGDFDNPSTEKRQRNRRSRQRVRRTRSVRFDLSDEEYTLLSDASQRAGLARGAYAAQAMLAAARGTSRPEYALLREALGEVMRASAQARRVGVNLNQVVAALNSTGELPPTLIFFADAAYRTVRNLDELAEQLRARLP